MKNKFILLVCSALLTCVIGFAQTSVPAQTNEKKIQTKLDIAKDPTKETVKSTGKQPVKKVPEKKKKAANIKPVEKAKAPAAKTPAKK